MEQVFPVNIETLMVRKDAFLPGNSFTQAHFRLGVVERILGPGRFIVAVDGNLKVEVQGSAFLKVGSPVKMLLKKFPDHVADRVLKRPSLEMPIENRPQWTVSMSLGFGGKNAASRLEVYTDRKNIPLFGKDDSAIYFVFSTGTEMQGEIQWCVHLMGKYVSIRVYKNDGMKKMPIDFETILRNLEDSLRKKGFFVSTPTVILKRPMGMVGAFQYALRG